MASPPDNSNVGREDYERRYSRPYGKAHPIPTIQGYREIQKDREDQEGDAPATKPHGFSAKLKQIFKGDAANKGDGNAQGWAARGQNQNVITSGEQEPARPMGQNQNVSTSGEQESARTSTSTENAQDETDSKPESDPSGTSTQDKPVDTTEAVSHESDPKAKRKAMKKHDPEKDSKSRQVTDPITHLPVEIHDFTVTELNEAPINLPRPGSDAHRKTSLQGSDKEVDEQLEADRKAVDAGFKGMQKLFPPPSFEAFKAESTQAYQKALLFSMLALGGSFVVTGGAAFWMIRNWDEHSFLMRSSGITLTMVPLISGWLGSYMGFGWLSRRMQSIWDDQTWAAAQKEERKQQSDVETPESSMWLNFILAAIWPLVNPDLFNSLVDTLEDVMQASLPRIVRMIAIEDFGQGKSAIRILGVRSLPPGAAGSSVTRDGEINKSKSHSNDRDNAGESDVGGNGTEDKDDSQGAKDSQDDPNLTEGMESESGDFLNLEIAFSYRATPKGKGLKERSENAHLYLIFYLPSNIPVPVWVSVDGIVGIIRMRIQIAPDPPFINLCTLSFMGQPKASISCVPLMKKGLDLMDVPFLSSFVQSSIDAALAEYVAPKSITLDLKQMLQGDDFKKDCTTFGVLFVKIHSATGMEAGDIAIPLISDGSSDCYVSCGWAKFSKPIWSSRVIVSDMKPSFEEHCMILVGPEEVHAGEKLRLQLWDSDKTSADDDLGRIEVDLAELMSDSHSDGKMWQREDSFVALDGKSSKPGSLKWEVGYFTKVDLKQDQFDAQTYDPKIRSMTDLKKAVNESAKKKLREAPKHVRDQESSQQQKQEFYEQESELICAAPPPNDFPSGVLSIQIHNAYGLEIQSLQKKTKEEEDEEDPREEGLPSPYCSVIINSKLVYKTRTKPKNSNPFYNAGTERFIRNWRDAEVIISVRDARVHENDALLGIIYLPLEHVLSKRAQSNEIYPLSGGIGHGKLRVSMMFRAVDIKLPMELQGWDYGTVEIGESITSSGLPADIQSLRMKLSTSINRGKMRSNKDGSWHHKRDRKICLAVSKRYASNMVVEFRSNQILKDKTAAWAILWLKDIPDDEEREIELAVWTGDQKLLKRAKDNVLREMGEKVGTIKLNIKFYAGLHDGHSKLRDSNIDRVMECLAVASENHEINDELTDTTGSNSSDSDSDSSSDETKSNAGDSANPIKKLKDYKQRSGTLHRQHRGLMQWKVARKADWLQSKLTKDLPGMIKDSVSRKGKSQGVETEI